MPFFWFKYAIERDLQLAFGDIGVVGIFGELNFLDRCLYSWWDFFSAGRYDFTYSSYLPLGIIYTIWKTLPIPVAIRQSIVFSLIIMFSLIFTYLFLFELFEEEIKIRRLIAFFGALFYILNFSTLFFFIYRLYSKIYGLPFFTLFLYLLVKGERKANFQYAFLLSLSTAVFSVVFQSFTFGVLIVFVGLFYHLVFYGSKNLRFISMWMLTFLPLNSFYFLPYINTFQPFAYSSIPKESHIANLMWSSKIFNLLSAFTLTPRLDETINSWVKSRYVPWVHTYTTLPFLIIRFFYAIIAFIPLLKTRISAQSKKILLFFTIISLFGMFAAKGTNEPYGFIEQFVIENIPFAGPFRVAAEKFQILIIVSYTVLFGYGMMLISSRALHTCKVKTKYFIFLSFLCIAILSIFGLYSFPFWTGQIVTSPTRVNNRIIDVFIKIPDYYYSLKQYLDFDKEDYKLASLPLRPSDATTFNWEYSYQGVDFLMNFFNRPTFSISVFSTTFDPAILILNKAIENDLRENSEKSVLDRVTGLLNIRYLILHHDIDIFHDAYPRGSLINESDIRKILVKDNFTYVKSFGQLELFSVPNDDFLPHIYSAPKVTLVEGNIDELIQFISLNNFTLGKSVLLLSDQLRQDQTEFIKATPTSTRYLKEQNFSEVDDYHPQIIFEKINPTKYVVKVVNASKPFYLIFSETYNPLWKVYVNTDNIRMNNPIARYSQVSVIELKHRYEFTFFDIKYHFSRQLADKYHFVANGYANAWYIDPAEIDKDAEGSFTLTLYFSAQTLNYLGIIISIITLVSCIFYLILHSPALGVALKSLRSLMKQNSLQ
jgi:hypothetical protein